MLTRDLVRVAAGAAAVEQQVQVGQRGLQPAHLD
jgi:hypothetical protein